MSYETVITKHTLTLLNNIKEVNPLAALSYMGMLLDCEINQKNTNLIFDLPSELSSAFLWSGTPQGHNYWSLVNREILEKLA